MEETRKWISPNLEKFPMSQEYAYVFCEIPALQSKRDITFSINLMPRSSPVSKTPYRMNRPKIKGMQIKLE
jgi:hypothetical protein